MIDTSKYEGHTPAPWQAVLNHTYPHMDVVIAEGDEKREAVLSLPCWVCEEDMLELTANAQLMADSPLLLKEVKRLRRAFHIATAHIGFGNHLGHAELRRALNSVGIDYNSLPWADGEWEEPLPTFGGVAHYD